MNVILRNASRFAVIGALFAITSCALTAGVTDSADKFFGLIKENKVQEAYSSTAKAFQAATTVDQFKAFITGTTLDKYASASWPSSSITNNTGHIEGSVTTSDKGVVPLTMDFVNEDGAWKVFSITPASTGKTTTSNSNAAAAAAVSTSTALPSEAEITTLTIKSMSDFADAIATEDFSALYGTVANVWKAQMTVSEFQETFKQFMVQKVDLSFVKTTAPVIAGAPTLDENKILKVEGTFTGTLTATYILKYYLEDGVWKLVGIDVKAK